MLWLNEISSLLSHCNSVQSSVIISAIFLILLLLPLIFCLFEFRLLAVPFKRWTVTMGKRVENEGEKTGKDSFPLGHWDWGNQETGCWETMSPLPLFLITFSLAAVSYAELLLTYNSNNVTKQIKYLFWRVMVWFKQVQFLCVPTRMCFIDWLLHYSCLRPEKNGKLRFFRF